MLIYNNIKPDLVTKTSCALGMFDGVHLGHQEVIRAARNMAQVHNCASVVVSFSTHPQLLTAQTPTPLLTTLEDRLSLFEKCGVDIAVILDFDKELQKITADDYIKKYLVEGLHAKCITIGYDHHFGRGKRGNQFLLAEMGEIYDFSTQVIAPVSIDGQIISSSIIRKMLRYGDIKLANKLLGRDFMLRGIVEKGVQRGRQLGYPTANVKTSSNILVPACGVYSVEVQIGDTFIRHPAVMNIGFRPTFSDRMLPIIETFILDFNKDIYGEKVCIYFKERIREEKKFNSAEDLIVQIKKDVDYVKERYNHFTENLSTLQIKKAN